VLYDMSNSEMFDTLQTTHVSIEHGGRDRMIKKFDNKYKTIKPNNIKTFLDFF
jgi:hypothetical protein